MLASAGGGSAEDDQVRVETTQNVGSTRRGQGAKDSTLCGACGPPDIYLWRSGS